MKDKFILDVCCGGRHFWFNKEHPNAIYQDIRVAEKGNIWQRPNHCVKPDMIGDFRKMDFPDKSFKLIVFDPPHLTQGGDTGWQVRKYGKLNKQTWQEDLSKGFKECWRCLDDFGVLVFKWNDFSIKHKDVLGCFDVEPLFGHPTAKSGKTKWFVFMKIPK